MKTPTTTFDQHILIINAGSSSIKFTLYGVDNVKIETHVASQNRFEQLNRQQVCSGQISNIGNAAHFEVKDAVGQKIANTTLPDKINHEEAIAALLTWLDGHFERMILAAIGHRVVHGGAQFCAPIVIDDLSLQELKTLIPLAPLHQPHALAAIQELKKRYPNLLQIACFDTAFHHDNSALATSFALPQSITKEGVRRYGFHGLSYEYIAKVAPTLMGETLSKGKIIVAHLGAGASLCAINNGCSVATTMGFTALDGLMMSRRCGALDAGVVLYLMQAKNMSAAAISDMLYNQSGLLGVSGMSDDMRILEASDQLSSIFAIELFVYRIKREIGSLVAALGGLDALVFTAGIGENSALIRQKVVEASRWIGLEIDDQLNATRQIGAGLKISTATAKTPVWVIPTNEELMIAQQTFSFFEHAKLN